MNEHVAHVEHVEPPEQLDYEDRAFEIEQTRGLNLRQPSVPNTTKVVRLFVVDPERGRTFEHIVAHEHPTRSDVFVVTRPDGTLGTQGTAKSGGDLEPMTWLGHGLVKHQDAHDQHRGTVPVLKGIDRDQLEWQCDVPFRVSRIEKVSGSNPHGYPSVHGPDYPFEQSLDELNARENDDSRPIRSGPTKVIPGEHDRPIEWKQLYKAHFELKIGGTWKPLDPDVYCEWR